MEKEREINVLIGDSGVGNTAYIDHNKAKLSAIINTAMDLQSGQSMLIQGNGDIESEPMIIKNYHKELKEFIIDGPTSRMTKKERVRLRGKKIRHGFKNVK